MLDDSDKIPKESVIYRTFSQIITNKLSTFGVWEVPIYFWLNFKLKREQEIAVKSMFKMNQAVLVFVPTAYGKG